MLIKLNEMLLKKPLVKNSELFDYRLTLAQKDALRKKLGAIGYGFDTYTSFAITDRATTDKPANFALIPNQYFAFASEMYEFASELYKYFEIYEKLKPYSGNLLGSAAQIKSNIETNSSLNKYFESENDLILFSKFLDKDDSKYRLGSKRLINDKGQARSAKDCFGSVVLKEINLPDASSSIFGRLVFDLCSNPSIYKSVYDAYCIAKSKNESVNDAPLLKTNRLSKPFLLLAGISGTGKTRFVREQAKISKRFRETYCLSSVRPDWHEPSDLLGYVSRLNGPSKYITTDVLQFIARAWRGIVDSGLNVEVQAHTELGKRLVVEGKREDIDNVLPYWLCLDEMNLAPVEQYFADYLSVLETREWDWQDDGSFTYSSDALLKSSLINDVEKNDELREALGFGKAEDGKYDELWKMICEHGLGIPFNLIVAGTVNMDETTHGFSRKVIDRALSFDFGEFFPNNFDEFGEFGKQKARIKRLGYPVWSNARKVDVATTSDPDGALSIAFLSKVNSVLKDTPFELAYRALNELLLAVAASQPQDKQALQAVWDDFMMCKVLPRIEGDEDKLAAQNDENLLEKLQKVLENEFDEIWESERPDLYREKLTPEGEAVMVVCRAKKKLNWMNERLGRGFTTFWP